MPALPATLIPPAQGTRPQAGTGFRGTGNGIGKLDAIDERFLDHSIRLEHRR